MTTPTRLFPDDGHRLSQQPAAHRHRVREDRGRRAARYRRMEGCDVQFLMGNDENTVKVSQRPPSWGATPGLLRRHGPPISARSGDALDISTTLYPDERARGIKQCCRKFIQKVYDDGYIYKGEYGGWYCEGCEEFKTDQDHKTDGGDPRPPSRPWPAAATASRARAANSRKNNNGVCKHAAAGRLPANRPGPSTTSGSTPGRDRIRPPRRRHHIHHGQWRRRGTVPAPSSTAPRWTTC